MLSSRRDPDIIFSASKIGADDFLVKPVDAKDLDRRIGKILEKQKVTADQPPLRDQVRRKSDFTTLFGTSPNMEEIKNASRWPIPMPPCCIRQEAGTGNLAHDLPLAAPRSALLKSNCAPCARIVEGRWL